MEQSDGTFSGSIGHDRREGSGPLELAYLNLVKLKPGTVLNERYRLEKLIGQGGFGIVFAARDLTLNSLLAIKFLDPRLAKNEKKFLRVQREINLSRRISDARIIKIFSLESWQGIHFLVMELAAGGSLKTFLQEKGGVPWSEFRDIFLEILEAVAVLHANGIVHRDLKPANILITEGGRVKILDFGLAKEVDDIEKTSTAGEIVGSPYYMSPEQIRGLDVDCRSDVYQLGLILYRTLSGRHPFEHTSTMEVIFKQLNQRPERLLPVEGGLPRFLRAGLDKALEKSPARRFRDAGAMARFFKKDRLSWPQRVFFSIKRGRLKWALAAALLAVTAWSGFRATFGSQTVHELRRQGSVLEARNRFGVRLWRRDFSPWTVFHAHATGSSVPIPQGTGLEADVGGLQLNGRPVVFVLLVPPLPLVFPSASSIISDELVCQQAILDGHGALLRRGLFLRDYEFDSYDYVRVIKPYEVTMLSGGRGGEADALLSVQQYQSMYPSAMVFMRGIKKFIYTNPGTFETFPQGSVAGVHRFMFFGVNNLFSHMSFIAENGFVPDTTGWVVIKGIPNLMADYRANIAFVGTLFILPAKARMIENRWQQEGRARFEEGSMGDILDIDRQGRMTVRTRDGVRTFWDSPDTLRRVYTRVNNAYQERVKRRNLRNARGLIAEALSFPLQNPYLRSALLYLQGDLEVGLGRYPEGEMSLLQALQAYPGNNDANERLCEMEVLKGDPNAALRRLDETFADSSKFWGFQTFGVSLFKSCVYLQQGMNGRASDEIAKLKLFVPDIAAYGQAMGDLFRGDYAAALAAARELEKWPLGALDLRELRLLLGRALLLDLSEEARARFLFEDISRNSLEYGHLAEISTCYFLARSGRTMEAAKAAREAFTRLQARARGDFMTRIWLFYDAYLYGRTMEIANDPAEAARGYRACIEANPHTGLAGSSRQRLALLERRR
ncbi:MAG: protein kinase [Acidobacteria bacterium]|nr:protein kinase [Acidobacteriota bacterium]